MAVEKNFFDLNCRTNLSRTSHQAFELTNTVIAKFALYRRTLQTIVLFHFVKLGDFEFVFTVFVKCF
jgi:hypothetical protein